MAIEVPIPKFFPEESFSRYYEREFSLQCAHREASSPEMLSALYGFMAFFSKTLGDDIDQVWSAIDDLSGRLEKTETDPVSVSNREERDAWIYNAFCDESMNQTDIARELRKQCREKGWPVCGSANGAKKAAKAYAKRHNKPVPARFSKRMNRKFI